MTSCRWRPPPRMHSFTATTRFKISRSFVSPCVCCMLCRMRLCCILQVVMVQFLSINFFTWISSIFVGFLKSSSFFVSLCTSIRPNPLPSSSSYSIICVLIILHFDATYSKHMEVLPYSIFSSNTRNIY